MTCNGAGSGNLWPAEEYTRVGVAISSVEIAIGGKESGFSGRQNSHVSSNAGPTSWRRESGSGGDETLRQPFLY